MQINGLTMETADEKLAEMLIMSISSLQEDIKSRLKSMLGVSEQTQIPTLLIISAEIELVQTIYSQYN